MSTLAKPMENRLGRFSVFGSLGVTAKAFIWNIIPIMLAIALEFLVRTGVSIALESFAKTNQNRISLVLSVLSSDILLLLITYPLCQGVLIDRILSQLLGQPRSIATSFQRVIAIAPAYLVCVLPVSFSNFLQQLPAIFPEFTTAIRLGNIPMVVIILATLVAGPIYLIERPSVHEALERSAELTAGRRIKIFLAFVIVNIFQFFIIISATKLPILFLNSSINARSGYFAYIETIAVIATMVGGMIYTTLMAVTYCMLRYEKDRLNPRKMAEIFE